MAKRNTRYLTTGRLVESVMRYRGMDVQELAELVGEHPMNFYKLLNGRRPITPEMASKLGKALNMSPIVIMESRNLEMFGVKEFMPRNCQRGLPAIPHNT